MCDQCEATEFGARALAERGFALRFRFFFLFSKQQHVQATMPPSPGLSSTSGYVGQTPERAIQRSALERREAFLGTWGRVHEARMSISGLSTSACGVPRTASVLLCLLVACSVSAASRAVHMNVARHCWHTIVSAAASCKRAIASAQSQARNRKCATASAQNRKARRVQVRVQVRHGELRRVL